MKWSVCSHHFNIFFKPVQFLALVASVAGLTACGGQPEDDLEPISFAPKLVVTPVGVTIATQSNYQFQVTGGTPPYTFQVPATIGTIQASGLFTSGNTPGSAQITLSDSEGQNSSAYVKVVGPVSISPTAAQVGGGGVVSFSATGGQSPYAYSVRSGQGSIQTSTGVYTAGALSGVATIRVVDAIGQTSDGVVTITPALSLNPLSATVTLSSQLTFNASGGAGGYNFSIVSGGGSIGASTGIFTAPALPGVSIVRVSDNLNNLVQATVTMVSAVQINPEVVTLAANQTVTMSGSGGLAPYSFDIVSGLGSINSATGVFTAPGVAGTSQVRITDAIGQQDLATVTTVLPVSLSPASSTIAVGNTITLSASGGSVPYTYSVFSGGGSIHSSTGVYTASGVSGGVTVQVSDSLGQVAQSFISVQPALTLTPSVLNIETNGTYTFSASGGVTPRVFSIQSGSGSINSSTGLFQAPATPQSVTVRVLDAWGNSSTASVQVIEALEISPVNVVLVADEVFTFSVTGGTAPYTFSNLTGNGAIDSVTGEYQAHTSAENASVRVTDVNGFSADATITVYEPISIDPQTSIVGPEQFVYFTTTGGYGAISFAMVSGNGAIDEVSGAYEAPTLSGLDTVQAMDSLGNMVTATVSITQVLQITPAEFKMAINSTRTFSRTGGLGPFSYDIVSGGGTIHPSTGVFTAPAVSGVSEVRVTDSVGNESVATVTIVSPVRVFVGSYNGCLLFDDGSIKCWGDGAGGKLLAGSTTDRGDGANEMGSNLSFLNLGTGRTVKDISIGYAHICAILDNDRVKCWGSNANGRLGLGDTASRGDGANESGDALPFVDLGSGRTAKKIFAGFDHTCAILDNNDTKCWGNGIYGKLGGGSTITLGDNLNEMGDNLPVVSLGSNRYAVDLALGNSHTCALLDNNTVKCWGRSNRGQLGYGNTLTLGDASGEMGDSLATVSLGSGKTAKALSAGQFHNCAILNDDTVKCWGYNNVGQLGQGNTTSRGDGAGEMGDALAVTSLGTGLTPEKIVSFNSFNCVTFTDDSVKCWGQNTNGALGQGSTSTRGDGTGEMGNSLAFTNLGGSFIPTSLGIGYNHGCALSSTSSLKCWGRATQGALGNASTINHLGDVAGEMGDVLPQVSY